ncbi:hypothetical protein [Blastococcus sp. TF02A-26]|uniref:hypothetical protein n=1 Tax=Blastococcus sp. TF02A-26 TaxID=2250577 RepID=UPI000DEBEFB6|nr:hypothetical protein [Blastococcus sp. TF02A-26]RBY89828.1 hypothetical protein DQ240_02630 [Blastococcus sp. TF02A-26]
MKLDGTMTRDEADPVTTATRVPSGAPDAAGAPSTRGGARRGAARSAVPGGRGRLRLVLRVASHVVPVLFVLAYAALHARRFAYEVPTFHLDGAFQTVSGLLRIADGEWPGRDFFPYLGIGPVLAIYPVFALRGGDLADSVFSSHFVTLVAFQFLVGVVAALVFSRRRGLAMVWGMVVPTVLVAVTNFWPSMWWASAGDLAIAAFPGNSLRPIRAVAPYLLAAVALVALRERWTPRRAAVVGASAGLIVALWSNDYGLVSGGLLLAVVTFQVLRRGLGDRLRGLGALWGAALVGFLVSGFAATAGHFPTMFRYNFSDVRGDQSWYFASWEEPYRVYSLGDLVRIMDAENVLLTLVVLVAVAVYALLRRGWGSLLLTYVGGSLLAGGLAGTIGGHQGMYFWSFHLWGTVVLVMAAARALTVAVPWLLQRRGGIGRSWVVAGRAVLAAAVVGALVVTGSLGVDDMRDARDSLAEDPEYVFEPRLGGYLSVYFRDQVAAVDQAGPDVVEEYMGLAGALTGPNRDLPVDSVIAALGSQRAVFEEEMEERTHDLVATTVPGLSDWVSWNVSANWWFYRSLFRSYEPVQVSPTTLHWTPVAPAEWADVPCTVQDGEAVLGAEEAGLYEVTLDYVGPGANARSFTMVENNINIAASARGFVPLDPGAESQRFPVAVNQPTPGGTTIAMRDISPDDEPLTTVTGCSASAITVPDGAATMQYFSYLMRSPVDLTDTYWTRGVANDTAAFFVPNTVRNQEEFEDARAVRFSDGVVRTIRAVEPNGPWLDIRLEGPPLDPAVAGAPNSFTLRP